MTAPLVGIVMGSDSDWEVMQHAARRLTEFDVPHERRVVCAHRTPDLLFRYAEEARGPRAPLHHRRRRRRRAPAGHARRQDHAARPRRAGAHRRTSRDSTRCSPSCRCRPAFRSPPSRSGRRRAQRRALRRGHPRADRRRRSPSGSTTFRAAQTERVLDAQAAGVGVILPGATVGVLGGGQLGRMFTLAGAHAWATAWSCSIPTPTAPPAPSPTGHLRAGYTDERALDELARSLRTRSRPSSRTCRPPRSSAWRGRPRCAPPVGAVAIAQDRIAREDASSQSPASRRRRSAAVRRPTELAAAARGDPLPALLKTSRLGYDGKGQAPVDAPADAARPSSGSAAWPACWRSGCARARALGGARARRRRRDRAVPRGRRTATATASSTPRWSRPAIAATLADEAREPRDAPRGAHGLHRRARGRAVRVGRPAARQRDGAAAAQQRPLHRRRLPVDQFEQQVRALCGLPLGEPRRCRRGDDQPAGRLWERGRAPRWAEVLRLPGVRLHLYGKPEPRPGRRWAT